MFSRALKGNVRDNNKTSVASSTSPSGSESSFVSAASKDTSGKGPHIGQSASHAPSSSLGGDHYHARTNPNLPASNANTKQSPAFHGQKSLALPLLPSLPGPPPHPAGSYFVQQPGASGTEPRSPKTRRAPASRSSHGIETSRGPPPSLSTQRSYNADPSKRVPPPTDFVPSRSRSAQDPHVNGSVDPVLKPAQPIANDNAFYDSLGAINRPKFKSTWGEEGGTKMEDKQNGFGKFEDDQDSTIRIGDQPPAPARYPRNGQTEWRPQATQEDLFLNLARADSVVDEAPETMSRSERRRSRLGWPNSNQTRASRPSSSAGTQFSRESYLAHHSSPHQPHERTMAPPLNHFLDRNSLASLRDIASQDRTYAASAHPIDHQYGTRRSSLTIKESNPNFRVQNGVTQQYSPKSLAGYSRRRSLMETSPGLGQGRYKQSNLPHGTNEGDYGTAPFHKNSSQEDDLYSQTPSQTPHPEGTESTVSTTAPSTVWDELDDLKSRLRKLEVTGKRPMSSTAANPTVQGERPPTATTTMTTMSSSPKRRQVGSQSPEASTLKGPGASNIHPLLHSALVNLKTSISENLYKALEATATDALTLAVTTGSAGSQGTTTGQAASNGTDRQLRRKADSMCRSLTELCIAMAENEPATKPSHDKARPGSREANLRAQRSEAAFQDPRFLRAASDDPELRSSSRVMSRVEARRTSMLGSTTSYVRQESPQQVTTPTQTAVPVRRLEGTSSVPRRPDNNEKDSNPRRPLSRATTEVGQIRSTPSTRASRDYTSQHPLPSHPQRSPSVQSSLPTRKSYFGATQSPVTPNVQPGNKRYLDRSTPPSSADSARLVEARQRRIASLGQRTSAGQS